MSDVVRTYSVARSHRRRRDVRRRTTWWRRILLAVMLSLTTWIVWTTRDTYPMVRLIPDDQVYQVYIAHLLDKRIQFAHSRVWELWPENSPVRRTVAILSSDFGMPPWVMNNLVQGLCHVSGQDLNKFTDPLFITRMSRIGCLIEKLHCVLPGIQTDYAGGLRLRAVPNAGIYYAVRGRILALSPSRQAVIRALTLPDDASLAPEALDNDLQQSANDDLAARISLRTDDPLGNVFQSLYIALQITPDMARLNCRGNLRPAWRERMAGLLNTASPRDLTVPPEGLLVLSGDFGAPISALCEGLNSAVGETVPLNHYLAQAAAFLDAANPAIAPFLRSLFAVSGPGIRFSWHGIDQNEMLPMPELVIALDTDPAGAQAALEAIPPPPQGTSPWDTILRYDPERLVAFLPMIGGPSIEPTAALHGSELLISTSRTLAESLLAEPPQRRRVPQPANLYLRWQPYPSLQALSEAALQFADASLLRGHTRESFETFIAPWMNAAKQVSELAALAAHENGELRLDVKLVVAQAETAP